MLLLSLRKSLNDQNYSLLDSDYQAKKSSGKIYKYHPLGEDSASLPLLNGIWKIKDSY